MQRKKFNFQRSVRAGYYTTLSYEVINDVLVLFTFANEVTWFDTLISV